ncbi:MAG: PIN domain-containing protein [Burkholderiales bacterium]
MLFIDSNQYLDFYRTSGFKKLFSELAAVSDRVFITSQIVDEVTRKKVAVANKFFCDHFGALKLEKIKNGLPNQLFSAEVTRDLQTKIRDISQQFKSVHQAADKAAVDVLMQISLSKDDVSKAFSQIFQRAVDASESELDRARVRKERGRAPGKSGDSLGDQISWEQFLTRAKEEQWPRVWIISRDGDNCSKYAEAVVLNAALYCDLVQVRQDMEVRCFTEIEKGLTDFINVNSVSGVQLPTYEEAEAINREQEALPPIGLGYYDDGGWYSVVQQMNAHRRNFHAAFLDPNAFNQHQPLIIRSASNIADE